MQPGYPHTSCISFLPFSPTSKQVPTLPRAWARGGQIPPQEASGGTFFGTAEECESIPVLR